VEPVGVSHHQRPPYHQQTSKVRPWRDCPRRRPPSIAAAWGAPGQAAATAVFPPLGEGQAAAAVVFPPLGEGQAAAAVPLPRKWEGEREMRAGRGWGQGDEGGEDSPVPPAAASSRSSFSSRVPPLDMFLCRETVRGRRVSERFRGWRLGICKAGRTRAERSLGIGCSFRARIPQPLQTLEFGPAIPNRRFRT
jgi:hypothetical protein